MTGNFYRVSCPECDHEQIIFNKPANPVHCVECDHVLATPTGGKAILDADVLETVEAR